MFRRDGEQYDGIVGGEWRRKEDFASESIGK
jgi:hypothetical protein